MKRESDRQTDSTDKLTNHQSDTETTRTEEIRK